MASNDARRPVTPCDVGAHSFDRPLAFVLSGGGSFGAGQVGMLRALAEARVRPDLVVGSSVGALNGAIVAAHIDDAHVRLADVWRRIDRRTIFGGGRLGPLSTLVRSRTSLCRPDRLGALISAHLSSDAMEDLPIAFAAVCTDLATGAPRVLTDGRVMDALLASAAIPGVFPPVMIDGRAHVDGGVAANVPVRQALDLGAATVIVLDANPLVSTARAPRGIVSSLLLTVPAMLRNQYAHRVDDIAPERIVTLPRVTPPDIGSFDFSHTEGLMEEAYLRAVDHLAAVRGAAAPAPPTGGSPEVEQRQQ